MLEPNAEIANILPLRTSVVTTQLMASRSQDQAQPRTLAQKRDY
jgi:hypothetical protein